MRRPARIGIAPEGAVLLGEWASPRMSVIVKNTNRPSDNYMAETLLKALGADYGGGGTTAAGVAVASSHAAEYGAEPTMVDGSGLSRRNFTTPRDVVELLAGMDQGELAEPMLISLAVAGQSGTLVDRMRGTAAQGRCRAKTGTLDGVSNLAGICHSRVGRPHRLRDPDVQHQRLERPIRCRTRWRRHWRATARDLTPSSG